MLKGLLMKDFCVLMKQMKMIIILMVIMAVVPYDFARGFALMYSVLLPITALAYDEQSKWEYYAQMMPYRVKDLVLSKYLLGIYGGLMIAVLEVVSIAVTCVVRAEMPLLTEKIITILLIFCVAMILMSINLPLIFKLGTEKGRFVYILLTVGITMAVAYSVSNSNFIWEFDPVVYPIAAVVLAAVSLIVSMGVSQKVYGTKYR